MEIARGSFFMLIGVKGEIIMQEEVEHRSVTLIVNTGKFTGRVLKAAIAKHMAHRRKKTVKSAILCNDFDSFGYTVP